MSVKVEGVPESISREDYLGMIEAAGFDVNQVVSLRFATDGIHAKIFVRGEGGKRVWNSQTGKCLTHRVFIPVKDAL